MNIEFRYPNNGPTNAIVIERILSSSERDFNPILSDRINIKEYSSKLANQAQSIFACINNEVIGFISFYSNIESTSYLSILCVSSDYRGHRIGMKLVEKMLIFARGRRSSSIELECNDNLIPFYQQFGFSVTKSVLIHGIKKSVMQRRLSEYEYKIDHLAFSETEISTIVIPTSLTSSKITLQIKHDDLFSVALGGNKARKLQYIFNKVIQEQCNAIVTAGDINSNHNRATAIMAAKFGLKAVLIVHNDDPDLEKHSINANICRLCGAELIYCSKKDVAITMDMEMDKLRNNNYKPFYLYGGGHIIEGSFAYYDAILNIFQNGGTLPDYIFLASGTGTTHAGIHVGAKSCFPNSKVVGISIAREATRGKTEVLNSARELESFLHMPYSKPEDIQFIDTYIEGGYESYSENIYQIQQEMAANTGVILDQTYSGKAFYGMVSEINSNPTLYSGKSILFWNTGGIFNLLTHNK